MTGAPHAWATVPAVAAADEITVVGIGADGWSGLPEPSRRAVHAADVLLGSTRQLDLVPDGPAEKVGWPSPLLPQLDALLQSHAGRQICVLASGDPLLSGIATTLVNRLGRQAVRILPAVSSATLARARLGWSFEETAVISSVGRSVPRVARVLAPDRKVLVLSADGRTPAAVAAVLRESGYGASTMTVLADLGATTESRTVGTADTWPDTESPALNVIAVHCVLDRGATPLPTIPGLPDDAFEHDGQLTKRDLRASALARLVPLPGQLLWDIGAGAGTVAIEWLRSQPGTRARAFERDVDRAARIERNARRLGVPELDIRGDVPDNLPADECPDAIFVGGAVSAPGLLDVLHQRLAPGGRIVAHAVTLESEQALAAAYGSHGGELTRIAVEHASPLGTFTGWRPARTVTQWSSR